MPSTDPKDLVTVETALDLLVFEVAVSHYLSWIEEQGMEHDKDPLAKKAFLLLRRYKGEIQDSLTVHFEPFTNLPGGQRLKPSFRKAIISGEVYKTHMYRDLFYQQFLRWGKSHQKEIRDTFRKRSKRVAREVLFTQDEDNHMSVLNTLAGLPSVSGRAVTRMWIRSAAKMAGAEVSDDTAAIVDTETAQVLSEMIAEISLQLESIDPVSEKASALEQKRADLLEALDIVVTSSERPERVRTNAEDTISKAQLPEWVERKGFNDKQKESLLAEGKLLINAGAGSGKTTVMAAKVAYLVREKGYDPDQILATSFTRVASAELKERVFDNYGISGNGIGVTTHAIANMITKTYDPKGRALLTAFYRGSISGQGMISNAKAQAFNQLSMGRYHEGRGTEFWNRSISERDPSMAWVNRGGIPQDATGVPISQKALELMVTRWRAEGKTLEEVKQEYQGTGGLMDVGVAFWASYEWLKKNGRTHAFPDFDDMLEMALTTLKTNPKAKAALQKQYKVVLVDEAQDQNKTQNDIFDILGEKSDVFAYIGDDRQSIYAFRGASPQSFVDRADKGFQVLTMETNYRSGANIVNAGENIIAHNGDRQLPKVCKAVQDRDEGSVSEIQGPSHNELAAVAVSEIANFVEAGDSPDSFGIVVRNNAEKDAFMLALLSKGIPFKSKSGMDFFKKKQVKAVLNWIKVATLPPSQELNTAIVSAHSAPGFYLNKVFVKKLESMGGNFLDHIDKPNIYGGWRDRNIAAYGAEVLRLRSQTWDNTAALLEAVLEVRGKIEPTLLDWLAKSVDIKDIMEDGGDPADIDDILIKEYALAPVMPLKDIAAIMPDPERFLGLISDMSSASAGAEKDADTKPAVRVDTAHQWKGLEAENVYVMMAKGVWPNYRNEEAYAEGDETALDEDRRLAYVAITRGRESVTVLSPALSYLERPAGTSRFVEEACIQDSKSLGTEGEFEMEKEASVTDQIAKLANAILASDEDLDAMEDLNDLDAMEELAETSLPNPEEPEESITLQKVVYDAFVIKS